MENRIEGMEGGSGTAKALSAYQMKNARDSIRMRISQQTVPHIGKVTWPGI
jgi:hypothetical protein